MEQITIYRIPLNQTTMGNLFHDFNFHYKMTLINARFEF